MPVQTVIKLRRDTAANWDTANSVLAAGEQGYETDTGLIKIGDGTTAWGALPYQAVSRIVQPVKNTTGSSIAKGSVVYISGATGGDALISLADADTEATSSKTIGLTAETIANDAFGDVVCEGLLSGVNTSAATAGDSVWLSSTAGGFVFAAPPAKPAHSVYLGVVTRVSATEGEILVKIQNGYELNELHDVNITGTVADKEVLAYDNASSMWINQTAAEAGLAPIANPTFTGVVSGNANDLGSASNGARAIGFMGIPQNATTTGAYTIVAADAGEHIYSTATRTVTIPSNASVPFQVGTTLVFISGSGATTTIAITSDTLLLAGTGSTGSRTLAPFGMATAVKITSTSWIISGNGLS